MKRLFIVFLLLLSACSAEPAKRIKISLDDAESFSKPGPEHAQLATLPGTWKARSKFWFSPNSDPQESTANVTREWIMDGRFIKETYKDLSPTHPFEGIGIIGFDKVQKIYQSTWIDTMTTSISTSTGTLDKDGKIFTFKGATSCPMVDGQIEYRAIMKILSEDTTTYEMYMKDKHGKEFQSLEIVYIKQK